jgi:aconitase A
MSKVEITSCFGGASPKAIEKALRHSMPQNDENFQFNLTVKNATTNYRIVSVELELCVCFKLA